MLKFMFRTTMPMMVWMYQRTHGKFGGRVQGLPVLLLTTIGRKTRKQRTTPLGYFEDNGAYVITASFAGLDEHPGWYHNLKANPRVGVQIAEKPFTATADEADPALRARLWEQLVTRSPGYGAYEKRTTRVIPMVLLRPVS